METTKLQLFTDKVQDLVDNCVIDYLSGHADIEQVGHFFQRQECPVHRLAQSIVNYLPGEPQLESLPKYKVLIERCIDHLPLPRRDVLPRMLQALDQYIDPKLDSSLTDWTRHRNVTLLVFIACDLSLRCHAGNTGASLEEPVKYFLQLSHQSSDHLDNERVIETLHLGVMLLERISLLADEPLPETLLSEVNRQLSSLLLSCSGEKVQPLVQCIDWCQGNLFPGGEKMSSPFSGHSPSIRLCHRGLIVRSDSVTSPLTTVVSSVSVTSESTFYYEVLLLSSGAMRIGWIFGKEENSQPSSESLGENGHSLGFDGFHRCVWHNVFSVELGSSPKWARGDTVGVLLNRKKAYLAFYLNGDKVDYQPRLDDSWQSFYPAISLSAKQKCIFNFGTEPFTYAPAEVTGQPYTVLAQRYRLEVNSQTTNWQSRKLLHFSDPNQDEIDDIFRIWLTKRNETLQLQKAAFWHQEWVKVQGHLRFSQALLNALDGEVGLLAYYAILFNQIFAFTNIPPEQMIPQLFQMLHPLIASPVIPANEGKHRNVCLLLMHFTRRCAEYVNRETIEQLTEYLLRVFASQSTESILYGILAIEQILLCKHESLQEEIKRRITESLLRVSNETTSEETAGQQVKFCSQWCLENALVARTPLELAPAVKLSPHRLTLRRDGAKNAFICSQYLVTPGRRQPLCAHPTCANCTDTERLTSEVYYYEVTVVTCGSIQIGWTHGRNRRGCFRNLSEETVAIAYDGYGRCVWRSGLAGQPRKHLVQLAHCPPWKCGDIVGCLLDLKKGSVQFRLNGVSIYESEIASLQWPSYCAAISLSSSQQCALNFGQTAFKYPPEDEIKASTFHMATDGDATLYHLVHLSSQLSLEPEEMPVAQIERWRKAFDQWIIQLETAVNEGPLGQWDTLYGDCLEKYTRLMAGCRPFGLYVLLHSMIRAIGTQVEEGRLGILVSWLEVTTSRQAGPCGPATLLHLLKDHSQEVNDWYRNSEQGMLKQRNSVIVLALMCQRYYGHQLTCLFTELAPFLARALTESFDKWTQLYAITCYHLFVTARENRQRTLKQAKVMATLRQLANLGRQFTLTALYGRHCDLVRFEVAFNAQCLLSKLVVPSEAISSPLSGIADHFPLKVSPDGLSVRNDLPWNKTTSSAFATSPTSGATYYEVVLCTAGPMRLGWSALKGAQKSGYCPVGDDAHSLAIDLYHGCIWHRGKRYHLARKVDISPGDVLGCLLDAETGKATFTLNGQTVEWKPRRRTFSKVKVTLPSGEYRAAVTLFAHQQVYFNFGRVAFKYGPSHVPFRAFEKRQANPNCDFCKRQPATQRYLHCEHFQFCPQCGLKQVDCPICTKERHRLGTTEAFSFSQ